MEYSILEGMSETDRREVLAAARRRRFARNEVIFHEGDPGDALHLIAKGHVAVRVATPLGDVATLTILAPGDTFGELALVTPGSRRTASVAALEVVETLSLHRDRFEELIARHPTVQGLLVEILARQVSRLSAQLVEAYFVPAEKRVLRCLARLGELYATGEGAATVPIDQQTLASLAGTTRPTVNRILGEARDAGLVDLARGRIEVRDRAELTRQGR